MIRHIPSALALILAACAAPEPAPENSSSQPETIGYVEAAHPELSRILDTTSLVEVLAGGYEWTEGPVWAGSDVGILFSDTRTNTVHRWTEADGARPWLVPSGYTGSEVRGGGLGSNGLILSPDGRLVLCQHGDRRLARLESEPDAAPRFATLADSYQGRRFNSPNDLAYGPDGSLYFTDPPYGLTSPGEAELSFSGVYRLDGAGTVELIDSTLSRPNGIAFSPDGTRMYVANSDPEKALWMVYDVSPDGHVTGRQVFAEVTEHVAAENPGLPDGLKLDQEGRLFATGPGGVWIFEPDGTHLGTIRTEVPTANVAFGDDGSTLYLTSNMYLARIETGTMGAGF